MKHVVSTGSAKTQGISCYPHGTGPSFWGGWELIQKPKKARTKLGIPSWEKNHISPSVWQTIESMIFRLSPGWEMVFCSLEGIFFPNKQSTESLFFLLCCSFRPFHPFILFGQTGPLGKNIETLEQSEGFTLFI